MSRSVIIDWQRDGLVVAVGHRRGSSVVLDRVAHRQAAAGDISLAQQLQQAVSQLGVAKWDATVIVPRELLEVRTLQIPRAEADELPDMVRFQAQRQMANMGDNWPIDFVLLPAAAGQDSLNALAFTIAPGVMTEIETACTNADIKLNRVLARPIELARYATAIGGLGVEGVTLAICLAEGQGDLLLLRDGRVVQIRGTRLPLDEDQLSTAIVGELRRSLLAAASNLSGQPIAKTLLIGSADMAQKVEVQVAEVTRSEVTLFDPAALLPASIDNKVEFAHRTAGRLAAIAAVVHDPSADKQTVVDLKNPKRRPPKKNNTSRNLLVAASAALVALLGFSWWNSVTGKMSDELADLTETSKGLDVRVESAKKRISEYREVENFLSGSVNLLDQLEYVAQHIPDSEKLLMRQPTYTVAQEGKEKTPVGKLTVDILADSTETLDQLKAKFDDNNRKLDLLGHAEATDTKQALYKWKSKANLTFRNVGWNPLAASKKEDSSTSRKASPQEASQMKSPQKPEPSSKPAEKSQQAETKVDENPNSAVKQAVDQEPRNPPQPLNK